MLAPSLQFFDKCLSKVIHSSLLSCFNKGIIAEDHVFHIFVKPLLVIAFFFLFNKKKSTGGGKCIFKFSKYYFLLEK